MHAMPQSQVNKTSSRHILCQLKSTTNNEMHVKLQNVKI